MLAGGIAGRFAKTKVLFNKNPIASREASSAVNALNLNKYLASQAQMSEAGKIIAGAGSRLPFRDAPRIAKTYGGNVNEWVKKTSSSYLAKDGTRFESHWVENLITGQKVEFKTKLQ